MEGLIFPIENVETVFYEFFTRDPQRLEIVSAYSYTTVELTAYLSIYSVYKLPYYIRYSVTPLLKCL